MLYIPKNPNPAHAHLWHGGFFLYFYDETLRHFGLASGETVISHDLWVKLCVMNMRIKDSKLVEQYVAEFEEKTKHRQFKTPQIPISSVQGAYYNATVFEDSGWGGASDL
jgi:hypothetical protein